MSKLAIYRKNIDEIDKNIIKFLMLRFYLIRKIAIHKRIYKIKVLDKKRELQVLNNIKKFSKQHQKFIVGIFKNIINYSKKIQK